MKMRLLSSMLVLVLFPVLTTIAQNTLTLGRTTAEPRVDGAIHDKEYKLTADAPDMQLNLSWVKDTLYVGVSGQTTGWVAFGIGPGGMDGATIYIGFVSGGKTELKVQKGSGHTHGDTRSDPPLRYAMKEVGGKTTMEAALRASEFITAGQAELDLIIAMGSSGSFREYHKARYAAAVTLEQ
jgi:hypothetical protein